MGILIVIVLYQLLHFTQLLESNLTDDLYHDSSQNDTNSYKRNATDHSRDIDYSNGSYIDPYHDLNAIFAPPLLKDEEKKCATDPTTDFRCGCDPDCALYGDCCPDSIYFTAEEQKLGASTASCHTYLEETFYVVTRCPSTWEELQTRYLCEHPDHTYSNPMLDTLITSLRTNITYLNSYCASCHGDLQQDMFLWPLQVSCGFDPHDFRNIDTLEYFQRMFYDETTAHWYLNLSGVEIIQCVPCKISIITDDDGLSYTINCPSPSPVVLPNGTKALCKLQPEQEWRMLSEGRLRLCTESISWCAPNWNDTTERELCEAYTAHVSSCNIIYRNYHCALCNDVLYNQWCHSTHDGVSPDIHHSFSKLLDSRIACRDYGVYDSLSHECVSIILHQKGAAMDYGSCTNISFNKEQYILVEENHTVFVPTLGSTYYPHQYFIQDEMLILCLPATAERQFGPELGYVTIGGLSLSIICIVLHLAVLCIVPKLINLASMNLASLCVSLLLLYSSFIASWAVDQGTVSCVVVAVIMHYSLLASFLWMLIISFDIFSMARRTEAKLVTLKGIQLKRFMLYSASGWLIPALVAGSAVLLDQMIPTSSFAPGYGEDGCWFTHANAVLLFCLTPLIFVMSLNVVFFLWTSYLIRQVRYSAKTPAAHKDFKLSVRLFTIMGLTWMTGIIAATGSDIEVLWHLFVVFNSTQGVFIFLTFSCNRKVLKELQNVFKNGNSFQAKIIPTRTNNIKTQ